MYSQRPGSGSNRVIPKAGHETRSIQSDWWLWIRKSIDVIRVNEQRTLTFVEHVHCDVSRHRNYFYFNTAMLTANRYKMLLISKQKVRWHINTQFMWKYMKIYYIQIYKKIGRVLMWWYMGYRDMYCSVLRYIETYFSVMIIHTDTYTYISVLRYIEPYFSVMIMHTHMHIHISELWYTELHISAVRQAYVECWEINVFMCNTTLSCTLVT